jgi:hypothetical protein
VPRQCHALVRRVDSPAGQQQRRKVVGPSSAAAFFEGEALTRDDVFDGQEGRQISVQVTFADLTKADRDACGVYASGAQMVLRRVWDEGGSKLTGRGLRYERFDEIPEADGGAEAKCVSGVRERQPGAESPGCEEGRRSERRDVSWEMAHPDQCVMSNDEDATQFFGFRSVGQTRLAERFKFVFVPGLQDAAEEATERKGGISALARVVRRPRRLRRSARRPWRPRRRRSRGSTASTGGDGRSC